MSKRTPPLSPRAWAILLGIIALVNLPLIHHALRGEPDARVGLPYADDFDGDVKLTERYQVTGGDWRIVQGVLWSPGVRNNPLWLLAKLPRNIWLEFDAKPRVPEADVRAEMFGNGKDPLSGYRFVLSAQGPTAKPTLYRRRETDSVHGTPIALKPGASQTWRIERSEARIRWTINGQVVIDYTDPDPLFGQRHDRFGLSSGEHDVLFDRLRVGLLSGPLPPAPAPPPPMAGGPFADDFSRTALGEDWGPTEPTAVRLVEGQLQMDGARNHPVWLLRPIPDNAVIEFDASTESPEGDIKVEAWGDGRSFHAGDPRARYLASGYVFVLGGWKNTLSAIARMDEHAQDRVARSDFRVESGRRYHWRIARMGQRITWELDGKPFLAVDDPSPLQGDEHRFFAFSGWQSRVVFDNLKITAGSGP
ncbi:MAG: hypothetical protein ACKVPX_09285 [Myxococcaceae bacterium]